MPYFMCKAVIPGMRKTTRSMLTAFDILFLSSDVPLASWLLFFARDPFPDIRGAVSEFDAPRFDEYQEVHRTAVDQADFREIDGDRAAFLIERRAKDVNVVPCNPTANAQHHKISLSQQSVDSAGHVSWLL